jgi:restriction endonuclease S subunit
MSFLFNGRYQPVKLKELILGYQYGLSEKADVKNIGIPMLRMNNIFNSELDTNNLKYIKKTSNIEKYILNVGDILFNRTNSKELVGKTAIFQEKDIFTFASYLIRVVINPNLADNFYINYLFNSSILQVQKDMVSRQITGQANINAQEMQDFLFPLPPIEKQKQISNHLNSIKAQIRELNQSSIRNKEEAILEFEKEIFK